MRAHIPRRQSYFPSFTSALRTFHTARRFRKAGISSKVDDSGSSIGKRYARNDELGTPFAITVDFQTVQDGTVTLRERDSTKQIREKVGLCLIRGVSCANLRND